MAYLLLLLYADNSVIKLILYYCLEYIKDIKDVYAMTFSLNSILIILYTINN